MLKSYVLDVGMWVSRGKRKDPDLGGRYFLLMLFCCSRVEGTPTVLMVEKRVVWEHMRNKC